MRVNTREKLKTNPSSIALLTAYKNKMSEILESYKKNKAINSLGISFSIWNKKNADGSESQVKEFTSLLGSQKKKLLNGLPSKLSEVLYSDTCETVEQIWTDFECLYNQISDFNLSKTAANAIFLQAKS